jgi:periplasmic protein TonB
MLQRIDGFEPRVSARRLAPLSFIVLLHGAVIYALLAQKISLPAAPQEVLTAMIITDSPRPKPAPQPALRPEPVPKKIDIKDLPKPPDIPKIVEQKVSVQPDAPPSPAAAPAEPQQAAAPSNTIQTAAAAPPAPPAPPAQPKTITSGVEYLRPPRAEYPSTARRLAEEGKVMLRVLVNERGQAAQVDIQLTSGSPRLDEAARQAVQRALFKPYVEDGRAVAVFVIVPIAFKLG